MADVIVEKENKSGAGLIVAIVAIVVLVLAALWILPGMFNSSGNNTTTPAPTSNSAPTTGQ